MVLLSQHISTHHDMLSTHFRDIFKTMSYASRSHRGRFRRMTVSFEHCFLVLTRKGNNLVLYFCDILPHFIITFRPFLIQARKPISIYEPRVITNMANTI